MSSCYEYILLQLSFHYLCPGGHLVSILLNVAMIQVVIPHGEEHCYWSGCYIHCRRVLRLFSGDKLLRLKPLSSEVFLQSLNRSWDKNLVKLQASELPSQWSQCCNIYILTYIYIKNPFPSSFALLCSVTVQGFLVGAPAELCGDRVCFHNQLWIPLKKTIQLFPSSQLCQAQELMRPHIQPDKRTDPA